MSAKNFGEKILKRTIFGTRTEDIDVVMTVGNNECRMDYRTAFRLSAFLRSSAKQAKRNAGDTSKIWTPSADLTDANLDDLKAQKLRDGTAAFTAKVGDVGPSTLILKVKS